MKCWFRSCKVAKRNRKKWTFWHRGGKNPDLPHQKGTKWPKRSINSFTMHTSSDLRSISFLAALWDQRSNKLQVGCTWFDAFRCFHDIHLFLFCFVFYDFINTLGVAASAVCTAKWCWAVIVQWLPSYYDKHNFLVWFQCPIVLCMPARPTLSGRHTHPPLRLYPPHQKKGLKWMDHAQDQKGEQRHSQNEGHNFVLLKWQPKTKTVNKTLQKNSFVPSIFGLVSGANILVQTKLT